MSVVPDDLQPIYVVPKTSIGGYVFDAVLSTQHESTLSITSHPVESGAAISDHSYVNPAQVTLQIAMSDVAHPIGDQFSGGRSRSVTAYQLLLQLQEQRIPLQLTTRLKSYSNMLVQSISAPDDVKTFHALRATVVLKEIFSATVETVKISARPHLTDATPKGEVQPVPADESTASQILGLLFGPEFVQRLRDLGKGQ
jgi:hypothetical protein